MVLVWAQGEDVQATRGDTEKADWLRMWAK